MKKISVLLVDDHVVVRQGLRALLTAAGGLEVVGEAENGRRAVALARKTRPDVVVMDVAMPHLNGQEATRQVLKAVPGTKVLALSSYREDEYVRPMLQAGAAGYVLKQTAAGELLNAIREVHAGKTFFSHAIPMRLRSWGDEAPGGNQPATKTGEPTSREAEVVQLIAEGFSNKQIAAELGLSVKTVEKHRQQVMDKLHIHDIAGLTRYAIARGWVESRPPPLEG